MHEVLLGKDVFLTELRPHLLREELARVGMLYDLMLTAHEGQCRDGGAPYATHAETVARRSTQVLIPLVGNPAYRNALWEVAGLGLGHDIYEDNPNVLSAFNAFRLFGYEFRASYLALSRRRHESYDDYLERLLVHNRWQAWLVKCQDKLHNMQSVGACSREKRTREMEKLQIFYPFITKVSERAPDGLQGPFRNIHMELMRLEIESGVDQW